MPVKNIQKHHPVPSPDAHLLRTRKKAAGASTNESIMAAELKNSEHGNEKPAR